ncbi:MAG: spermidine/putrescine transporter substrate-binding protein [Ilumatobacteraceae bacterium]|nr:spermidine/putrescine transporter substrate-binding protein [Ilumatobacteraceae bacterium]
MTRRPDPIRILAPHSFRQALSRRSFLQIGGAAAGVAFLAACGGSDDSASDASAPGGTAAAGDVLSQFSEVVNKSSGTLSMFTWGDYNDPTIVGSLAESDLGVTMKVDYYASNEDLITKLSASNGSSGYDIVVPTGPFIPQMIEKKLLQKFDKSKLPNMVNVDPLYLGQSWDPGNDYSVCKDWGSTGWMWNTKEISKDIATWNDFISVSQNEASGNVSVLDSANNITGMYYWANGIDWTTEKKEDIDACEKFLVDEYASHIKAFDSYPSTKIAEGAYTLSMAWNGDARQAFVRIADAGGNPDDWKWALGAPNTELWMDNYVIPTGAPNPDAAHAWINWLLTPEISIKDLEYHGYNSGMKNMEALLTELAPDLVNGDMIFFSDAQVATMHTGAVNSAQDRTVDILNKVKAKAGG